MNFNEYQEKSKRTCATLKKDENDLHMVLGMLTEVGELADVYKKYLAYGKEIDRFNVIEELGDLMWYVANFCRMNNIDFGEVLRINIEKLQARYPSEFNEANALRRDLETERNVLEGKVRVMMPGGTITEINTEDLDV